MFRFSYRSIFVGSVFCFWVALYLLGCDESLPPRDNPTVLFQGDASFLYMYSLYENDFQVFIDVKNIYGETIQDTALVRGTLEIILKRDPRYRKTASLSISNLVGTPQYDPLTNSLTIDPGKSVTFLSKWDLIDDDSVDLRTAIYHYDTDPSCESRMRSQTETFIFKGSIQITKSGGEIFFGPKEFDAFYVTPSFIVNISCPSYPR